MGHTWKVQITHSNGSSTLTFADGDDVSITPFLGLTDPPTVRLERNTPAKAVISVRNIPNVPERNVLHSSFNLWTSGDTGPVRVGNKLTTWHRDESTGVEAQTFCGRILSISEDGSGNVSLIAYDDLMIPGETKDSVVIFDKLRDRMGNANVANGPTITCTPFPSSGYVKGNLPDSDVILPLVRVAVATPTPVYEDLVSVSPRSKVTLGYGYGQCLRIPDGKNTYFRIRLTYKKDGDGLSPIVFGTVYSTTYSGGRYVIGSSVKDYMLELRGTDGQWAVYDGSAMGTDPVNLTPGEVYAFCISGQSGVELTDIKIGVDTPVNEAVLDQWTRASDGTWSPVSSITGTLCITPMALVDEEVPPSDYEITPGSPWTIRVRLSDFDRYRTGSGNSNLLRLSYYYGKLSVLAVMQRILSRAGFNSFQYQYSTTGAALMIGYYSTGSRSYLECLQELADMVDPTLGVQWTFSDSGYVAPRIIFGTRHKPWAESPAITFSNAPMDTETAVLKKKIKSHQLRREFEAKVGTVRIVGKAFDGLPVAAELDDRLYGSPGSLVLDTGSPLTEYVSDSGVSDHSRAILAGESMIMKQHGNELGGSLTLDGFWPSLWEPYSEDECGSSKVIGLSVDRFALSASPVVARALVLGKHTTELELDTVRPQDLTMSRRGLDQARRSESFSISSMPETVLVFARASSVLPAGYTSYDRIRIKRSDGATWTTSDTGTRLAYADDHCSPDGDGHRHWSGYFPGGIGSCPTSYKYSGGVASVLPFNEVAVGDGTNWTVISLTKTFHLYHHQNVLVNIRGERP